MRWCSWPFWGMAPPLRRAALGLRGGTRDAAAGAMGPLSASAPLATQTTGEATDATKAANAQVLQQLPFADMADFDLASRGLVEATPDVVVLGPRGLPNWDMPAYSF